MMERRKQGSGQVLLAILLLCLFVAAVRMEDQSALMPFLMKKSEVVVKSEGGEIRVFIGRAWNGHPARMHIGLFNMEPNTLLIPHYVDADLILFLLGGEAKIGWIHKDDLVNRQLKPGDILRIPAGSAFYLVNTGKNQRLQIISSIEPVDADLIAGVFTPFFIAGGQYPRSVYAGFDIRTLTSAFNATPAEVGLLTSARTAGPIVFLTGNEADHLHHLTVAVRSAIENPKQSRRLHQQDDEHTEKNHKRTTAKSGAGDPSEAPDAYNIYNRDPNFRNKHGWSIEINERDYSPLKKSDVSVFLVNLTAGAMMAPHVNPRATEYGVVVAGEGTVEVVNANGTAAMRAEVREGDVFFVPRVIPFCQSAGEEGGGMGILGFASSARRNRPQFLVGKGSVVRRMMGKEVALGFGVEEEELRRVVMKQNESVILGR